MEHKRLTILCGHYGSGKTNVAVNLAFKLREQHDRVTVADLDIVNPYFRTKDSMREFDERDIRLICSPYANSNVDIPALPQELYSVTDDKGQTVVLDIGGDDRGAYALGRYTPFIKEENNYRMAFVANCYRPLTRTAEDAFEIMQEIEAACNLKFTCIINNSNLGPLTDTQTVLDSLGFIEKLEEISSLPLWLHTVEKSVATQLTGLSQPVLPLKLQEKYFDLPRPV